MADTTPGPNNPGTSTGSSKQPIIYICGGMYLLDKCDIS